MHCEESERRKKGLRLILTLSFGSIGALIALWLEIPVGALIGSTAAVSCCAFSGLRMYVPDWLRNMAFASIGCSIGSGISPEFLHLLKKWPASLSLLTMLIVAIILSSCWVLTTFFRQDGQTAMLASSPGALSYSLAVAADGVGDAREITVLQCFRLLFITTVLPLIFDLLNIEPGTIHEQEVFLSYPATVLLLLLTLATGLSVRKLKIPAIYLMAGMIISGMFHYLGILSGRPQPEVLFGGFVITGAVIGARFSQISIDDIRRMASAILVLVIISTLLSASFAKLTAVLLHMPFGQVWVAFAPGGVEAMAAMALAMDFDTPFVATHHLYRIILLLLILPVFLRIAKSKKLVKQK